MPSDGLGVGGGEEDDCLIVGGRYCILLTGIYAVTDYDFERFGGYPQMFVTFLGDARETWDVYPVVNDKFPTEAELEDYDGIVVSGSRRDAHSDDEWILKLCDVIKRAYERKQKILGVCFGHQIVSRALGGKTGRAAVGWELGLKTVKLTDAVATKSYARGLALPAAIKILVVHRDQVQEMPPGGELIGSSERCPIEMYAVGDIVLGIQGHPEFPREFLLHLIDLRTQSGQFCSEVSKSANSSLQDNHPDRDTLQRLCKRFLKSRTALLS